MFFCRFSETLKKISLTSFQTYIFSNIFRKLRQWKLSLSNFGHISSIVFEVIKTILSPFTFFLQNDFERKKRKSNQNQQNKNKRTKNNKGNNFLCTKTSKRRFGAFLCSKSLRKKNKQAWNGPDNLIYNTTALSSLCKFSCFTGMLSLTYMHRLLPKLSLSCLNILHPAKRN